MIDKIRGKLKLIIPEFYPRTDEFLNPYFTFVNYNKIWAIGISVLGLAALVPLIIVAVIHYQLIQTSVASELILRTERLTSNTRRAVTFFLEERLNALRFTVNEVDYAQLTDPEHLNEVLRNLKLGFGGLSDLSVISSTGIQVAYAGPFALEGKNYGDQPWFIECRKNNYYVSEIFRGYRGVPHIIIAVKFIREDNTFFIFRATLETERLIQTLFSYESCKQAEIFLINRSGIIQTPTKHDGGIFEKITLLPIPGYSMRTQTITTGDGQEQSIVGYAFISTQVVDTPFILMVIKQREGMTGVWDEMLSKINWFVGICIMTILIVLNATCTYMVNKMYMADKAKAETLALVEQTNQLASIGQLAAGVAHEINNPLALINETAGYIKDLFTLSETYGRDDELMENIDAILEAVERCGRITGQLLGFARKFDIKIQKISLKELVSDVLIFHKKEAEYRNIHVNVEIAEEDIEIESDRGKLQQILLNLVNNAFQAMNDGCWLDITAERKGRDRIVMSISDNGCGMPEETLPKIFEPFFTTKEQGVGTGLGLAITSGLIKKLHGEISVKSKQEEGTTFTITLPVRIQEELHINENTAGG